MARAPSLGAARESLVADGLRGAGLSLDLGVATVRVQGDAQALPSQLQSVYGDFPLTLHEGWADVHARVDAAHGLRRWLRPQVVFSSDGREIFSPFPADSPLPLLEWGCNWLIGQRLHHLLLLHAGALERDGLALVLPAVPGSGKSTFTAALANRGWRLLSDEFGAYDLEQGCFRALLKPVALKNESIQVIRAFAAGARFGPLFPKTRKGAVSHMAPDRTAVARRHEGARPGAVVLPRWEAGSNTHWEPLAEHDTFSALAFNAFNYQLLGEVGFDAVLALVRRCLAWRLVYSDLDDAIRTIERDWPRVVDHQPR